MRKRLFYLAAVLVVGLGILSIHRHERVMQETRALGSAELGAVTQANPFTAAHREGRESGVVSTRDSGSSGLHDVLGDVRTMEGIVSCSTAVEYEGLDPKGFRLSRPLKMIDLATEGAKYSLVLPAEISPENIKSGGLYNVVGVTVSSPSSDTQGTKSPVKHLAVRRLEFIKEYSLIDRDLVNAIKANDYLTTTQLLTKGAGANLRTTDYKNPLHLCLSSLRTDSIRRGGGDEVDPRMLNVIDLLMKQGTDVDALDCWGKSPLHYATMYGFAPIVDVLIARGAHRQLQSDDGYVFTVRTRDEQMHDAAHLSNLVNVQQDVPIDIQIWLANARLLLRDQTLSSTAQAEQMLRSMLVLWPRSPDAWVLLTELSLRQGQRVQVFDPVMRGLSYNPRNTSLLLLKARMETSMSPVVAAQGLRSLLDSDRSNTEAALLLATAYIQANEPERAIQVLQQHVASQRNIPLRPCNSLLASALHKVTNRKSEAYELFDKLIQSDPSDREILLDYAQALILDARWEQIRVLATEWAGANPDDIGVLLVVCAHLAGCEDNQAKTLADELVRRCQTRDVLAASAFEALRRQGIPRVYGDGATIIGQLALLLSEKAGQRQEALELAEKALDVSPAHPEVLTAHGLISWRLGQLERAIEDFTKCIQHNPAERNAAVAHFHLSKVLLKLKRTDEAVMHMKRALSLNRNTGGLSTDEALEVVSLLMQSTGFNLGRVMTDVLQEEEE